MHIRVHTAAHTDVHKEAAGVPESQPAAPFERRRSGYLWRRRWPRPPRARGAVASPPENSVVEAKRFSGPDRFLCFSLQTPVLRDAKM